MTTKGIASADDLDALEDRQAAERELRAALDVLARRSTVIVRQLRPGVAAVRINGIDLVFGRADGPWLRAVLALVGGSDGTP